MCLGDAIVLPRCFQLVLREDPELWPGASTGSGGP